MSEEFACVNVSFNSHKPSISKSLAVPINSPTVTSFSGASEQYFGEDVFSAAMNVEYKDSEVPWLEVELSMTCVSNEYGTEVLGPYALQGTLDCTI